MSYLIYDKRTTQILEWGRVYYFSRAAAQIALAKFCERSGWLPGDSQYPANHMGIALTHEFHNQIEKNMQENQPSEKLHLELVKTPPT